MAMNREAKIYVAGHNGMVGSAIVRHLDTLGYTNIVVRSSSELDLKDQAATRRFFETEQPEFVVDAAAKVGGIVANNTYRADFLYDNLMIQSNLIEAAYRSGVKKLLFLGSSCIYPKNAPQPLKETYLLDGKLEPTNEPYAIAKIAGIKLCENYFRQYGCDFISVMPTNLYGPNDNYDLEKSHVLPALLRKFHLGKLLQQGNWEAIRANLDTLPIEGISGNHTADEIETVLARYGIRQENGEARITLWGSGQVYREFLHVDDMAAACIHIMTAVSADRLYNELAETHINIGTGKDLTIAELAELVKNITGFSGTITWDTSKPDGTYRKQLDVELVHSLGWEHDISLKDGIRSVYERYSRSAAHSN
jgi:GDP-L-fucose synthase